jgi:cysteinyl-tRNA synthetase
MHVNFLLVNGEKMSKSLNNLYTLADLEAKGYEPLVYKMFNFSSSYRNQINFTWEGMDAAKIALGRLREGYLKHSNGNDKISDEEIKEYEDKFLEAINDDLNMQVAMSVVWDVIKNPKKSKDFQKLLLKFDEVLGLDLANYKEGENNIPEHIQELVKLRNEARQNKDWAESYRLRDELIEKGYTVKDTKEGTIVTLS